MALENIFYYKENEGEAKTFRDLDTNYWYYEYELVSLIGKERVEEIKGGLSLKKENHEIGCKCTSIEKQGLLNYQIKVMTSFQNGDQLK